MVEAKKKDFAALQVMQELSNISSIKGVSNENKTLILISKCIEHGFCRYDGSQISSPFVKRIKEYVDIITVCPESLIGLSTPREAIRIVKVNNTSSLFTHLPVPT